MKLHCYQDFGLILERFRVKFSTANGNLYHVTKFSLYIPFASHYIFMLSSCERIFSRSWSAHSLG